MVVCKDTGTVGWLSFHLSDRNIWIIECVQIRHSRPRGAFRSFVSYDRSVTLQKKNIYSFVRRYTGGYFRKRPKKPSHNSYTSPVKVPLTVNGKRDFFRTCTELLGTSTGNGTWFFYGNFLRNFTETVDSTICTIREGYCNVMLECSHAHCVVVHGLANFKNN